MSRYTSATDADRAEMLEAIGVELDRRAVRRRARGRAPRPPARPAAGQARAGGLRAPARPRRAQRLDRGRDHASSAAGMYDHYVPALIDSILLALGVPDALHALPARDLPGRAAGDVRVPDGDLRADRAAGLQRLASTRGRARSPPPATWRSCQPAHALRRLRAACTRTSRETLRTTAAAGARRSWRSRCATASPTRRRWAAAIDDDDSRRVLPAAELPRRGRGRRGAGRRRQRGRRADGRRSATR